jgi:hypothetical protein
MAASFQQRQHGGVIVEEVLNVAADGRLEINRDVVVQIEGHDEFQVVIDAVDQGSAAEADKS